MKVKIKVTTFSKLCSKLYLLLNIDFILIRIVSNEFQSNQNVDVSSSSLQNVVLSMSEIFNLSAVIM